MAGAFSCITELFVRLTDYSYFTNSKGHGMSATYPHDKLLTIPVFNSNFSVLFFSCSKEQKDYERRYGS